MNWDDKAFFRWFTNVSSSGDVLDIPARKITLRRRTASDVQGRKRVGVLFFVFKSGQRETLAETGDAVRSVVESPADFPDVTFGVLVTQN